ncbi:hypothetical protein BsWGS_03924 [Bradybaena similaris]
MLKGIPTGVGAESSKAKKPEEWTNKFTQHVKSIADVLSVLYDGLEKDGGDGSLTDVACAQQPISEAASAFTQHCQNLVCMMSEPTNGPVRLPLGPLLSAVSRCLQVSYLDVRTVPSLSDLAGVLPALHRAALEVLSQLTLSCKTSVLPHSRVIIDLCMQALNSARHMEISERSKTRAYAYQALCLIVQMFGWGKHMTRHCKSVIQELMTDIRWQNTAKQDSETVSIERNSKKQQDTIHGNKKGRKKKNKAESYVDLMKTNIIEGTDAINNGTCGFQVTVGALELAKLMLGQVGYSSVESLMRCIIDTAQMFHHEEPQVDSPYTNSLCQKALYAAVFSSAAVRVQPGCSRKDATTYFQLTNLAMSILKNEMQTNCCYEIQSVCRESINILQTTETLNRPIVRWIQPQENHSTRDETELEGEIEKIREENESLQQRLLDSDMEMTTQKSTIASLRKELETLKASRSNMETLCADQKVYLTDSLDNRLPTHDSDNLFENNFEQDESEDEESTKKQTDREGAEKFREGTENEQQQDQAGRAFQEHSEAAGKDKFGEGTSRESPDHHGLLTKRKHSLEQKLEHSGDKKRPKVDQSNNNNPVDDALQEMISDFVDADPDVV